MTTPTIHLLQQQIASRRQTIADRTVGRDKYQRMVDSEDGRIIKLRDEIEDIESAIEALQYGVPE